MKYAKILRIVGLTLLGLLVTSALLATPVQLQTAVFKHYKTLPYDAELFHLAYQTFLANEDTTDAFLLSQSAVRQRPNNTQWRMRLGKTALWSGHYDLALQQWTILAKRHPTQEIIDQGSHVAKASHDDAAYIHFQLINLKWHPHSQVILDNLVSAYEREGYPEKSVQLLKTHYQAKKPVFYLTKLAHLYDHLGDKKNEIATLEKLKKIRRKDIQFVLRQAEIYYNDAHLKQALEMLIQSKAYALPNNQDYWRTLGDLAWHLGQLPIALNAYQTLYQHHQADVENTRRLIVLLSNSDPNRAFQIAQQAWQTHRRPVFFMLSLEMGEKIGAWPSLEKLYANISKSQMPALTGSSLYWLVKASTWEHLNNIPQANAVYLKAFELYPNNQSLRIDYLYFLMASNQHRPLIHALQNWPIPKHPNNGLWLAYAQAFLYLKQPSVGLLFYEKHFQTQPALSVQNLIDYADMLETAGYSQLAYQAYATAWQLITVINTHKPTLNAEQLNQYFRLALNYASAETALNAIATHLEHTELSTDQYQALLSIALARENNDEIQDITAAQTLIANTI